MLPTPLYLQEWPSLFRKHVGNVPHLQNARLTRPGVGVGVGVLLIHKRGAFLAKRLPIGEKLSFSRHLIRVFLGRKARFLSLRGTHMLLLNGTEERNPRKVFPSTSPQRQNT